MKHTVRITRPTGDQRLVSCVCGWSTWCLYPYEARGEKEMHLKRNGVIKELSWDPLRDLIHGKRR